MKRQERLPWRTTLVLTSALGLALLALLLYGVGRVGRSLISAVLHSPLQADYSADPAVGGYPRSS